MPCFERSVALVFILCDSVADPGLSIESRAAAEEVVVEDRVLWVEMGWKERARGITLSDSWSSGAGLVTGDFSPGSEEVGLVAKSIQASGLFEKKAINRDIGVFSCGG